MRFRLGLLSLLALTVVATLFYRGESRTAGVFAVNPPTPFFHYPAAYSNAHGPVLVVHGLNSNKQLMNEFSLALAACGLEVYSIDLPGHGDAPSGFEATRARDAVEQVLEQLGDNVTVIGHSLGAGLLLDLANEHDFKSMVLLSPPPIPVNRIRAERVLVLTGEYDLPRVIAFIPQLRAGGAKSIDLRTVPWAGHSGAVFRTDTIAQIVDWLGANGANIDIRRRLIAIVLLFAWSILTGILLLRGEAIPAVPFIAANVTRTVLLYTLVVFAATLLVAIVPVLVWLRLFATDYLLGVICVAGIALLVVHAGKSGRLALKPGQIVRAVAIAAYVILVPGLLIASHVIHLTPSDGRWWRFAAIAVAALPFFIADEVFIRPLRPWWRAAGLAIVTRAVTAALILTGALTISRGDAFLVLIIHLVVLFWVALWFAAELVRRVVQDPIATAVFVSIVHAWVLAAMFITV